LSFCSSGPADPSLVQLDELCEDSSRYQIQARLSAAQNCTKVLQIEPENVKALYRRGLALINMSDFDQAREDLTETRSLEPGNHAIEDQLRSLEAKVQAQR